VSDKLRSRQNGSAKRKRQLVNLILLGSAIAAQAVGAVALWTSFRNPTAAIALVAALIATAAAAICELQRLNQSTERLEEEIGLYRRIYETSIDLILVTDRQGRFVDVSPSSFPLLGYEPTEMIGHPATDFILPDDLESTRKEMQAARRGRQRRNFEARYRHKDGRTVSLNWAGLWSQADEHFFFIGRDLTEQHRLAATERATQELLTAVVNASPIAIVCLTTDKEITVWSRAAEQIFGYTADEVLGKEYMLVPTQDSNAVTEYEDVFSRACAGETLRGILVKRRRKDGTVIDVSFDAAPMYGPGGGVRAIAYALSDVTERNRLEQQLRQSQKMDAIGQLTGGVAHDFNNMLTVITGTIDILAEGVADRPDLAEIVKLIGEAADRGAELTSQLLAFARRQPLQPHKTSVSEVATEAARLLRPTLGEQIDVEWKLAPDAWPALIDPTQLSTAIVNLAVNARDAMGGGGKLTIETANVHLDEDYAAAHSEVTPGPYVMLAISDTGPGIPSELRDKVFEPFFTTKDVGKGTGLGLSMVYGFVKQSGGHIKIYSEEGQGTTFKLYLPRADNDGAAAIAQASSLPIVGGTETILLVEDDPSVRKSVHSQLDSLGYRAIVAANATEALAIIDRGESFDLLFTDLIMPGSMNGRQLAEEAAKRRPGLKVLFTSGYTEDSVVHHGRLTSGVLLLAKPYRKRDLARRLRQALDAGERGLAASAAKVPELQG
jgi:PAS domain S-box-containing protein